MIGRTGDGYEGAANYSCLATVGRFVGWLVGTKVSMKVGR